MFSWDLTEKALAPASFWRHTAPSPLASSQRKPGGCAPRLSAKIFDHERESMKRPSGILLVALYFGTASAAVCQDLVQLESPSSHKFFPKGWVRGYTEFSVAPPHNEVDLNRCKSYAGIYGG